MPLTTEGQRLRYSQVIQMAASALRQRVGQPPYAASLLTDAYLLAHASVDVGVMANQRPPDQILQVVQDLRELDMRTRAAPIIRPHDLIVALCLQWVSSISPYR